MGLDVCRVVEITHAPAGFWISPHGGRCCLPVVAVHAKFRAGAGSRLRWPPQAGADAGAACPNELAPESAPLLPLPAPLHEPAAGLQDAFRECGEVVVRLMHGRASLALRRGETSRQWMDRGFG